MSFITSITGIPTTGSYGPDGNPSGINNNGGTETTPQNAGNVPSAGTQPRISGDNDKILSGNPYNQSEYRSSGTPISSGNPNAENRAKPEAQRLILSQQRNTASDSPFSDQPYAPDSYDWYKNESPAGSLTSVYAGTFSIKDSSVNKSGQPIGNYPYDTTSKGYARKNNSVTYTMGGKPVTYDELDGHGLVREPLGPTQEDLNSCKYNGPGLIDEPCEVVDCKGTYPLGKKMRVFQGEGCERSGYWLQATFSSNDMSSEGSHTSGTDCDTFASPQVKTELVTIYGNNKIKGHRDDCNCQKEIVASGGVSGEALYGKTFGHLLYYVGDSVAGIKSKEWCNWDAPLRGEVDPIESSGYSEWFWEGGRCNADGTRNETFNSGTLFGCCCTGHRANQFTDPPLEDTRGPKLYVLTEVSSITINTADDPCDCLRRKVSKSQFLEEWNASVNLDDSNHKILISGCAPADAESSASLGLAEVGYAVCSGVAPSWNETECAWDIQVKRVSRCPQDDTPPTLELNSWRSFAWCPSGEAITISDRSLFYSPPDAPADPYSNEPITYNHINYASCTGECSCTSGAPLFDVGDYVDLTSVFAIISGMQLSDVHVTSNAPKWSDLQMFDLSKSGANGGGGFQWTDSPVPGCDITANSWKVTSRAYGGASSTPDSLDCTWGYQIEFTGCAPCSGSTPVTCSGVGMAPNFGSFDLFIPESNLVSGAICTADASCPCVSGNSLFEVGDYVNINHEQAGYRSGLIEGYENQNGSWSGKFLIDLFVANSGHTATGAFSSGCETSSNGLCNWYFSQYEPGDTPPTSGYWTLQSVDGIEWCPCGSGSCQVKPDPNYLGADNDPSGIGCDTVSGCDIFTNSWKITSKAYGDSASIPNAVDCTWGYGVEFVGCPSGSGDCVTTGSAPASAYQYIPEVFFSSGTAC